MKKFFSLFALLLLVVSSSYGQNVWTYVSALPAPSPAINSLSVVDQNLLWVCCDAGGGAARCYKSTNGGVNWLLRAGGLPAVALYGISGIDSSNCWVGDVNGSIYRTTNGGTNWVLQFSLAGSFTNGIKMFNLNKGWFYGDPTGSGQPYQFRYTYNGGTNWVLASNAPTATSEFGVINAWDWIDTNRVWIGSANTVASSTTCKIYRSSTGYNGSWLTTSVTGTGGTTGLYYQTVAFIDANSGIIGSSGGNLRKTTDGGATYTTLANPPGLGTSFACMSMCSLKDASGTIRCAIDSGGVTILFRTTNLGTAWVKETIPSQVSLNNISHMQFINANLGFAATGSQSGGIGGLMKYGPPSGVINTSTNTPENYSLGQNFPNPFNPATTIKFSIAKPGMVTLKVYNSIGREVETLVSESMAAGTYDVSFDASGLTSGLYFYKITTNNFVETKKMLLVK